MKTRIDTRNTNEGMVNNVRSIVELLQTLTEGDLVQWKPSSDDVNLTTKVLTQSFNLTYNDIDCTLYSTGDTYDLVLDGYFIIHKSMYPGIDLEKLFNVVECNYLRYALFQMETKAQEK